MVTFQKFGLDYLIGAHTLLSWTSRSPHVLMRLDCGTLQGCCPCRGLSVGGLGIVQTIPGLDCTLFHSRIPLRQAGLYDPLVVRPLNVPGAMCWGRGTERRPAYPGES